MKDYSEDNVATNTAKKVSFFGKAKNCLKEMLKGALKIGFLGVFFTERQTQSLNFLIHNITRQVKVNRVKVGPVLLGQLSLYSILFIVFIHLKLQAL